MNEQPPGGASPPSGPQQPPWQQGPPPGPPPQKRRWPWVLLGCGIAALLVVILAVACTGAFFSAMTAPPEENPGASDTTEGGGDEESAKTSVGLGEPVDLGQWRVTVDSVETQTAYEGTSPQGEFAVVRLNVENIGTEATYFDSSAVSLVDADGNSHSSATTGSDDSLFLEQINPGNESPGEVVFDIPEGTEVTAVEVEDMMSPDGPVTIEVD
ncbi:DUF4352 domain-containing protein [Nocardiopsis flavescens]|uniref:DUF4352 domain-containing protein n=1 Tax=Nocardiopsis flavescens TaxID=758803 RepID=UPI003662609B